MTFPEWLMMVEQSGAPTHGVDMNWLQYQYQSQQQPAMIAQMIASGQAPRPMQPMVQPVIQPIPVYQPMYQQPPQKSGSSVLGNVMMGIFGFVVIIGTIIWGLRYMAKNAGPQTGPKTIIDSGSYELPDESVLKNKGLDTNRAYPYWPIVVEDGTTVEQDIIFGRVTNQGDKMLKNVTIRYGLYSKQQTKVGIAEDSIAQLAPGQTWEYRAKVSQNFEKAQLEDVHGTP